MSAPALCQVVDPVGDIIDVFDPKMVEFDIVGNWVCTATIEFRVPNTYKGPPLVVGGVQLTRFIEGIEEPATEIVYSDEDTGKLHRGDSVVITPKIRLGFLIGDE